MNFVVKNIILLSTISFSLNLLPLASKVYEEALMINGIERAIPVSLGLFVRRLADDYMLSRSQILLTTPDSTDALHIAKAIADKQNMEFLHVNVSYEITCEKNDYEKIMLRAQDLAKASSKKVLIFFQNADELVNTADDYIRPGARNTCFKECLKKHKFGEIAVVVHRDSGKELNSDFRYYFDYNTNVSVPSYNERRTLLELRFKDKDIRISKSLLVRILRNTEKWSWNRMECLAGDLIKYAREYGNNTVTDSIAETCFSPDPLLTRTQEFFAKLKYVSVEFATILDNPKNLLYMYVILHAVVPYVVKKLKKTTTYFGIVIDAKETEKIAQFQKFIKDNNIDVLTLYAQA